MLAKKLDETFGTFKEERHPYQHKIAGMVGEVLATVQKDLEAAVKDAQAKKATVEAEHAPALASSS